MVKESKDPLLEISKYIHKLVGDDPFKVQQLFGDQQVLKFLSPMFQHMDKYNEVRDNALHQQERMGEAWNKNMGTTLKQWDMLQINIEAITQKSETLNKLWAVGGDLLAKTNKGLSSPDVSLEKILGVGAGGILTAYGLSKILPKGIGKLVGDTGKLAEGVTVGKGLEKAFGVTPVYVTNWPSGSGGVSDILPGLGLPKSVPKGVPEVPGVPRLPVGGIGAALGEMAWPIAIASGLYLGYEGIQGTKFKDWLITPRNNRGSRTNQTGPEFSEVAKEFVDWVTAPRSGRGTQVRKKDFEPITGIDIKPPVPNLPSLHESRALTIKGAENVKPDFSFKASAPIDAIKLDGLKIGSDIGTTASRYMDEAGQQAVRRAIEASGKFSQAGEEFAAKLRGIDIGGRVDIRIESAAPARVARITPNSSSTEINVHTGPTMMIPQ